MGVNILGTSPDSIALAEDREQFAELLAELDIAQPEHGIARSLAEARRVARQVGYPVIIRPSFVLGGRAMAIVGCKVDGVFQPASGDGRWTSKAEGGKRGEGGELRMGATGREFL
jgi:formate-dependent phosphoribosylglycinamide formyltransferase (GAR transformylase)